ncbi:MAG TPA: indolepyruvate oxidoreductase subunit beta family protein [Xanthobacteraceae bacterium]|jgi:indolepyruvate ferredoxin oxidoreductase beta subunit|nr:indolepyruvate oxidoreductase subunit beta family protein [Xanthobacteraceae bacterium]
MSARPISILIAALGGEGGGVLTDWIIAAAASCDLPVQSTSIPGVAQRTGATTYYIEVYPTPWRELHGKRPVLALAPGIGDVDMVVASEFLEAGRAVAGGFVTPDRTLLIASTHRSHAIAEKMAMADGRFDTGRLMGAVEKNARSHLLLDMDAVARSARAMINSVMLGAVAASGRLPIPAAAFEAAIRAGKSSEANLRGFRAGLEAAERVARSSPPPGWEGSGVGVGRSGASVAHPLDPPTRPFPTRGEEVEKATPQAAAPKAENDRLRDAGGTPALPGNLANEPARFGDAADIVAEGVRRLVAYQDAAYARLYLDRLARIAEADRRAGARGRLTREVARHLALRMSYEDVIRVAEAKIAPARMAGIAAQMSANPDEPVTIVEFLKPGIAEMCSILPPFIARPIIATAERRGWIDKLHWGMEIKTTSVSGYLRLLALARLRRFRPQSFRYQEEQRAIEAWLALIIAAADKSGALALEIAECARLIKGYGDTLKRGAANYAAIERDVIRPTLAGRIPLSRGVDAVASARVAALADPEGEALAKCLAEIAASPLPGAER